MWKDNIQRLFRYRKINPSPALWEQLEAQLAESETLPTEQKSRNCGITLRSCGTVMPCNRIFCGNNTLKPIMTFKSQKNSLL